MDEIKTASQQIKQCGIIAILRGDFSVVDIDFVPTGGVALENIAAYARAGAVAVGMGSKLVPDRKITSQELTTRARALHQAWEQARNA